MPSCHHLPPTRRSDLASVTRNGTTPGEGGSFTPHHCALCLGSATASKTRAGGAAMKISARIASLSGVSWAVAISVCDISSFALFTERLQPGKDQRPALDVSFRGVGIAGESTVREFHQRAGILRLQLPKNFCLFGHPAGNPAVSQPAGRAELQELATNIYRSCHLRFV